MGSRCGWVCLRRPSAGSLKRERRWGTFPSVGQGEPPRRQPQVCRPPPERLWLGRRPRRSGAAETEMLFLAGTSVVLFSFQMKEKNNNNFKDTKPQLLLAEEEDAIQLKETTQPTHHRSLSVRVGRAQRRRETRGSFKSAERLQFLLR